MQEDYNPQQKNFMMIKPSSLQFTNISKCNFSKIFLIPHPQTQFFPWGTKEHLQSHCSFSLFNSASKFHHHRLAYLLSHGGWPCPCWTNPQHQTQSAWRCIFQPPNSPAATQLHGLCHSECPVRKGNYCLRDMQVQVEPVEGNHFLTYSYGNFHYGHL